MRLELSRWKLWLYFELNTFVIEMSSCWELNLCFSFKSFAVSNMVLPEMPCIYSLLILLYELWLAEEKHPHCIISSPLFVHWGRCKLDWFAVLVVLWIWLCWTKTVDLYFLSRSEIIFFTCELAKKKEWDLYAALFDDLLFLTIWVEFVYGRWAFSRDFA